MTNLETQTQYKPNWKYIVGVLVAWNLFEWLLARVWHVPYVVSFALFIPLAGLLLYCILPKPLPKNLSFAKYFGRVLLATCLGLLVLGVFWGMLKVLSSVVSMGWAGGITFFVLLQSLYWILYWINPRNRKPATTIRWFLFSLLFASYPILMEAYFRSTLKSLMR